MKRADRYRRVRRAIRDVSRLRKNWMGPVSDERWTDWWDAWVLRAIRRLWNPAATTHGAYRAIQARREVA